MADAEQELVERLAAIEFGPKGASSPLGLPMASVIVRALLADPEAVMRAFGATKNVMELPHDGKHVRWLLPIDDEEAELRRKGMR